MSAALAAPAPLLRLDDLQFVQDQEARVYDLTLARALGFDRARNIRRLIKSNAAELETYGVLVAVADHSGGHGEADPYSLRREANRAAGRPGRAFYLNEGQSLVVCALTRTPAGARVRGELIRVFMRHRAQLSQDVGPKEFERLVPAERRALRAIVAFADVVLAPPAYPVKRARDGVIPYLVTPLTDVLVEALASFEVDRADLEDGADAEPGADGEPSLGSLNFAINQTSWGLGGDSDHEADGDDLEDGGDAEDDLEDDADDSGIADADGLEEQLVLRPGHGRGSAERPARQPPSPDIDTMVRRLLTTRRLMALSRFFYPEHGSAGDLPRVG